ncbi:MAG TPA: hypothetical protein VF546_22920 [Pyrinomonadaceae bacterium]|jgi:hypothetical protein
MSQPARALAVALCLLTLAPGSYAQAPAKPKKPADASARGAADPLAAERRAQALTLINALADEARGYRDDTLRARVQAQAADTLWGADTERAKTLFRRAWDAAEVADQESLRQRQTARQVQGSEPGLAARLNRPNMRAEVLRLAAKRDRALGEELLARLDDAKKQEDANLTSAAAAASAAPAAAPAAASPAADATPAAPRRDPYETPPELARRLSLAMDFVNDGDIERALQFADPALARPYQLAVEFLVVLREKSPEPADQRYLALLGRTVTDPDADANTVLLLSSYVLTPGMYMTVLPDGGQSISQRRRDIHPPTDMPAAVQQAFAQAAAAVLARPLAPVEQDRTTAGRAGTYFVIARLLPFVEQHAPERAPLLRTQLAALTPDVSNDTRADLDRGLTRGLTSEAERGDPVQEVLDRLPRAQTPEQRDQLYMSAALNAQRNNDPRARDFVDKISDPELRQQVRAFVDFAALNQAVQKKDAAEALRLAQSTAITNVQRAWGLSEAARLLQTEDRARALESLESAVTAARRIDADDPDRARSLVAIATQFYKLDHNRAWELMSEAVKAANAAPDFTGSDGGLAVRVQTKNSRSTLNFGAASLDLSGVFTTLAQDDMQRAVELARAFSGEAPRANATLAIARAVLTEKPKPKS